MARHVAALWSALSLVLLCGQPSGADEMSRLEQQLDEDPDAIEAIALYPEEVRDAILEVAVHPELIVRLALLQSGSRSAFEQLLDSYPRHTQEAVWDLVRFPELVPQLAQARPLSEPQLQQLALQFPPEIRRTIVQYGGQEHELLGQVHQLRQQADAELGELVQVYPKAVQESVHRLLYHPEVLAILSDDMSSTILLGEAYKKNPRQVRERAARLSLELARQNAQALTQRPAPAGAAAPAAAQAPAEGAVPEYAGPYGDVARVYADQYAYEDGDLAGPTPSASRGRVSVTYHTYPYPYWFGYPAWYAGPAWGASLGWYITPRLRASVYLNPGPYYRLAAPRYHAALWANRHSAPPRQPRREHPRRR
ncbi:MAG: hypothetical protein ABIL09_03475 [Gemmatimonadota bacterium]